MVLAHPDFELTALGDLERIVDGARVIGKELAHLLAVFHIEAVPVKAKAIRVVEVRGRPNTEQDIVVVMVLVFEVVGVVGGDHRQPEVRRHRLELFDQRPGAVGFSVQDRPRHHRGETARGRDQSFAVIAQ